VRAISESVSVTEAHVAFSMVKVLSQSQLCGGLFLCLMGGSTGPGCSDEPPPSSVTRTIWGEATVTVKLHIERLPAWLVAVQKTVVVPRGKIEPEGGVQTAVAPGAVSTTAGGGYVNVAEHTPGFASRTTLAGQLIVGDLPSLTVMTKAQADELPAASVAEQFTVLAPSGKAVPDGGRHIVAAPGQLSVAEAVT
jgi:hypothetical protein